MQPIDLLAIAAHPDDVELSCAGTLLMAKRAGKRTGIIDLTQGESSTRGTLDTRKQETAAATKILGIDYRANLGMSDTNIELTQDNLHRLIIEIRKTRPIILLAPYRFERHPDHEAASELAHRAVFYSGLAKIQLRDEDGNALEPHRPLMVLHYMQAYTFEPRIIVDVTPVFAERMEAISAFASQFANRGKNATDDAKQEPQTFLTQANFFDWLIARASVYGGIIGTQYAEPFWSQEPLGTQDLFSLVTKKVA
jgi:N-acetylglucosamine malate deacetylase 1